MKNYFSLILLLTFCSVMVAAQQMTEEQQTSARFSLTYPIVGTNQIKSYDNKGVICLPSAGQSFFGQNANYPGSRPSYTNNHNGTVTDNVTGLMWSASVDLNGDGVINYDDKLTFDQAAEYVKTYRQAGYSDWRIPTLKELYSLIEFSGVDISSYSGTSTDGLIPFIDTDYFCYGYGDLDRGDRLIDAQVLSCTEYVSTTMNGAATVFGVNFVDGRIKGYPKGRKAFYVFFVRGNENYGKNNFVDNADSTITDQATGLMWMTEDSGKGMNWQEALEYAENCTYGGYDDWRLPDAKELQSIVDYGRSPGTTQSAAIDAKFCCTKITNEAGLDDYPFYWTSTTHEAYPRANNAIGGSACYLSFGRAMGYMSQFGGWIDVHGAGAQRSDPKSGSVDDYPTGFGPQGDARRIYNFVRLVRNTEVVAPDTTRSDTWRFAICGDTHVPNSYVINTIVPQLIAEKVEVAVFPGDLAQGGAGQNAVGLTEELEEWKTLTQPLLDAGIKVLAIRGNHEADVKGDNVAVWKSLISQDLNIVDTYRNVTFIGMDNYLMDNYVMGDKTVDNEWFSQQLARVDKDKIIVPFGHEPAFSCYIRHPDCLDVDITTRNAFWSLLEEYGIKYYFCGHSHMYNLSRISHNGTTIDQVICGGGGGELMNAVGGIKNADVYDVTLVESKSENGYLLVDVDEKNNGLSMQWITISSSTGISVTEGKTDAPDTMYNLYGRKMRVPQRKGVAIVRNESGTKKILKSKPL